jgi:hypothetical protein
MTTDAIKQMECVGLLLEVANAIADKNNKLFGADSVIILLSKDTTEDGGNLILTATPSLTPLQQLSMLEYSAEMLDEQILENEVTCTCSKCVALRKAGLQPIIH